MIKWIKVYKTESQVRAEIVKAVLEDHDMKAVVVDRKDRSYHFGFYEVHVASDNVMKAIKIINDDISFK